MERPLPHRSLRNVRFQARGLLAVMCVLRSYPCDGDADPRSSSHKELSRSRQRRIGFEMRNRYVVSVSGLDSSRFQTPSGLTSFTNQSLLTMQAIPGVDSAAAFTSLPFLGSGSTGIAIPGRPATKGKVAINSVSPDYFTLLGIPLLRGRVFSSKDTGRSTPVAIISENVANLYFGSTDVLGKVVVTSHWSGSSKVPPQRVIVGVVGNVRGGFDRPYSFTVYSPLSQDSGFRGFLLSSSIEQTRILTTLRRAFANIDSNIPPPTMVPYQTLADQSTKAIRGISVVFAGFAVTAFVLALAGVYATSAHWAGQRVREFGIRKALGAREAQLIREAIVRTASTTCLGVVLGFVLSSVLVQHIRQFLVDVSSWDAITVIGVGLVLIVTTIVATLCPSLPAIYANAADAIRYE